MGKIYTGYGNRVGLGATHYWAGWKKLCKRRDRMVTTASTARCADGETGKVRIPYGEKGNGRDGNEVPHVATVDGGNRDQREQCVRKSPSGTKCVYDLTCPRLERILTTRPLPRVPLESVYRRIYTCFWGKSKSDLGVDQVYMACSREENNTSVRGVCSPGRLFVASTTDHDRDDRRRTSLKCHRANSYDPANVP